MSADETVEDERWAAAVEKRFGAEAANEILRAVLNERREANACSICSRQYGRGMGSNHDMAKHEAHRATKKEKTHVQ